VVVGIGINIAPDSISAANLPPVELNYPVTCIECEAGHPVDRLELLHAILEDLLDFWLPRLPSPDFLRDWGDSLAFRGQWVELTQVVNEDQRGENNLTAASLSINQEGALQLITRSGEPFTAEAGEVHL
jgi:biotin-(acetyl-CoA carboxylase) ligase